MQQYDLFCPTCTAMSHLDQQVPMHVFQAYKYPSELTGPNSWSRLAQRVPLQVIWTQKSSMSRLDPEVPL